MRRLFFACLCLLMLCPAARGTEASYIALIYEGVPSRQLLEELDARNVCATFFLREEDLVRDPALAALLTEQGHEIGLSARGSDSLSRRKIAGTLSAARQLLPERCRPVFLFPAGRCGDALRQVAEVTGLSILQPRSTGGRMQPGDMVWLEREPLTAGSQITRLQRRGFACVTLRELARLQDVTVKPGRIYDSFPSGREGS